MNICVVRLRRAKRTTIQILCIELLEMIFQFFTESQRVLLQRGVCIALIAFASDVHVYISYPVCRQWKVIIASMWCRERKLNLMHFSEHMILNIACDRINAKVSVV